MKPFVEAHSPARVAAALVLMASLVGCVTEFDKERLALEKLQKEDALRKASPETVVSLRNASGQVITEVGLDCRSVPGNTRDYKLVWTKPLGIDKGETAVIWTQKFPDPLVIRTMKVSTAEGSREYPIGHTCRVGDRLVLTLSADGRVIVEPAASSAGQRVTPAANRTPALPAGVNAGAGQFAPPVPGN